VGRYLKTAVYFVMKFTNDCKNKFVFLLKFVKIYWFKEPKYVYEKKE